MDKVYTCHFLVCTASGTKPSKCTVIEGLLFKTGCVESVLITDIKWESLHDLFIRETEDFFQYQCTNDHIYRRVMPGWAVTVEYRKRSIVNFGEYMIRKIFCPRSEERRVGKKRRY